jgi:hypothetical protein
MPVVQGHVVHDTGEWQALPVTCLRCVGLTVVVLRVGLCNCSEADDCPLGKTEQDMRCTETDLRAAGVSVRRMA